MDAEAAGVSYPQARSGLKETAERLDRIDAAGLGPFCEFRDIDPAVSDLAVVDPGLRSVDRRAHIPLGQAGFLPEGAEDLRDFSVGTGMLSLGRHTTQNPCQAS